MSDNSKKTEILLVEDSPSLSAVYQGYLNTDGFNVQAVSNGSDALQSLEQSAFDVVLLDLRLPDMTGMDVLKTIHDRGWRCSVIIITAHGSVDIAIEAMRFGAVDFVAKPFDATRLHVTLDNVLEKRRLSHMVEHYRKTFDRDRFHSFVGNSLPMQAVFRIIESAAPSKATVFITGESGTGKELTAEALHLESERRDKPFIALNCAAIPNELMESEIFGHVKGAFTGAVGSREGAASRANGGTLFLDELCEMDLELQSKLLRFIQSGTFQRVGGSKEETVDVRFVCATNRDPLAEVKEGRFREDLYYRLNVIPVHLPPLNQREGDIMLIASEMLRRMSKEEGKPFRGFSSTVVDIFERYSWPGNVRELENVIRNIVVLNTAELVNNEMLPAQLQDQLSLAGSTSPDTVAHSVLTGNESERDSLAEVDDVIQADAGLNDAVSSTADIQPLWLEEKQVIERAIGLCDGNIPRAAAFLEISASTIYRKRQSWEEKN